MRFFGLSSEHANIPRMGKVRVRYYTLRRRSGKVRGYWQPSSVMRAAGFGLVSCGEDGPAAWQIAEIWNRHWDEHRKRDEVRRWPVGSVGAAFDDFRRTGVWAAKKPRTQEDWERGWAYIGHTFGQVAPETVVLAQIDAWYRSIVKGKGVREGWRALKIWRALWGAMIALGYCHKHDPSKAIRRQTPKARSTVWREGEVVRLTKMAWSAGLTGLAAIIAVSWDAALSPVDARRLTFAQMADDGQKITFRIARAKTGRAALGTLGKRASALVRAYIQSLPTPGNEHERLDEKHASSAGVDRPVASGSFVKDSAANSAARLPTAQSSRVRRMATLAHNYKDPDGACETDSARPVTAAVADGARLASDAGQRRKTAERRSVLWAARHPGSIDLSAHLPTAQIFRHRKGRPYTAGGDEMSELQPIETAPKDETMILLWFRDHDGPEEPRVIQGFWSTEYEDWFEHEWSSNSLTEVRNAPEYWMPLPEPPK